VCYFLLWLFLWIAGFLKPPLCPSWYHCFVVVVWLTSRFMTWWIGFQEESQVAVLGLGFGRSKLWNRVARIFAARNESEDAQFCKKTVDSKWGGMKQTITQGLSDILCPFFLFHEILMFWWSLLSCKFFCWWDVSFLQLVTLLALSGAWCEERDIFKS
jgi:hypothetical protein